MAIKVGVLGFAHGHVNAYCKQWGDQPEMGVSVVAGWDHDAGRLQQAVNAFGVRPFRVGMSGKVFVNQLERNTVQAGEWR